MQNFEEDIKMQDIQNSEEGIRKQLDSMNQLIQQLFASVNGRIDQIETQSSRSIKTPETTITTPEDITPYTTIFVKSRLPHPPMFSGNKSQWRG